MKKPRKSFAEKGVEASLLIPDMQEIKSADAPWRNGKMFMILFWMFSTGCIDHFDYFWSHKNQPMLQPGITLNIALNSVLMLMILAFGRVLHTTGRPYLTGLLAAHILTTTVLVGYIILILFPSIISGDQGPGLAAIITGGIIFLLIIILSGIFLSLERYLIPSLWLHRLATLGFLIALTGIVWRIAAA